MGFTLGTKFNEGTDWEFTVSQETIAEAVQAEGGITEADIGNYCYTAFFDARIKSMLSESSRNTIDGLYPWATEFCAAYNTNNGAHPSKVQMNMTVKDENAVNVYERNFLIWEGTIDNKTGQFLVMDMVDIKKWCMNCDNGTWNEVDISNMATPGFPSITGKVYTYTHGNARPPVFGIDAPNNIEQNIYPCNVVIVADDIWIGSLNPSSFGGENLANQRLPHQAWDTAFSAADVYNASLSYVYQGGSTPLQGWVDFGDYDFPDPSGNTIPFNTWNKANDDLMVIYIAGQYGNDQNQYETVCIQGNTFQSWKAVHTVQAWCGLLFTHNNVIYKPIIENGLITGFTSDMDIPSEWDDMTNVTGNNISPTPPSPTPTDGDDIDDHIMGAGSQLSGIAQLWLLTRAQLIDLHTAFANAPVNYDPMSSFISVMGLGISALRVVGDSMPWTLNPINIRMANGEAWHTGVEAHIVDKQVSAFNEVNIRINRKYNNFLDYSPYATHEIFLPMCGWLTLPDIAVDRGITVTYIPDIETLKVRAVVSVVDNEGNRCVVGEKDGVMGAEIPFTNIGHSLYLGTTVVQCADIAGEIVTGAIGAGFTKTNAKGGTYRPYEGFTIGMAGTLPGAIGNALVSGNINRTHFTTGNGSRIGFGDGENIQIKSTYHRIDKPNNYDHTVGKVCNKTGKLSEFTGFTVCDNPHINFSATEREKEEIKQLLEQGVIL